MCHSFIQCLKLQPAPKILHTGVLLERRQCHSISERLHDHLQSNITNRNPLKKVKPTPATLRTMAFDSSATPAAEGYPQTPTLNIKVLIRAPHQLFSGEVTSLNQSSTSSPAFQYGVSFQYGVGWAYTLECLPNRHRPLF